MGINIVGKHFPGHGFVPGDTHISVPKDHRHLQTIITEDIFPFKQAITKGIMGIMPADVQYPEIDKNPATFSSIWLKTILRDQLQFQGFIFSDCLSMSAASYAGDFAERTKKAFTAGCNAVLICNDRTGAKSALKWMNSQSSLFSNTDKLIEIKKNTQKHKQERAIISNSFQTVTATSFYYD
ncbi:MAG: hypothetical protein HAW62_04765 [Endozoicomonadaceae bacterium]|nr:hypothetical protein [Endozoicomonadaceae bacterium]